MEIIEWINDTKSNLDIAVRQDATNIVARFLRMFLIIFEIHILEFKKADSVHIKNMNGVIVEDYDTSTDLSNKTKSLLSKSQVNSRIPSLIINLISESMVLDILMMFQFLSYGNFKKGEEMTEDFTRANGAGCGRIH